MNTPSKSQAELLQENSELRARLEEAEETLRAIRAGEVDALVMGEEVYTLKGAETPYRLLMESMNEGAATITRDGTVLYCNHRLAEMAGIPAERIVGACLCQLCPPEQRPAVRALVAGALHVGARAELTFSAPDGPGLPVLLSLRPTHQNAETIAVVVADLSEHKRDEAKLRQLNLELEERVQRRTAELQAIFDTVPIGLAIAEDPEGRHIRGNPANERMLGLVRGEEFSLGAPQPARYRPMQDGRELAVEQLPMHRAVRGETVIGQVMDVLRPDGQTVTLYSNAAPLLDELGRPRGAVGAFLDITERKRAEEALVQAKERLAMAQRAAHAGAWDWDIPGGKLTWSDELFELFGLSLGPAPTFELWRSVVHPEDREAAEARIRRAVQQHAPLNNEYRIVRRDGGIRWISAPGQATYDASGQPLRMTGFCVDITERKQAEEALRATFQRFYLVLASMYGSILLVNDEGKGEFANQSFCDLFNLKCSPKELVGLDANDIIGSVKSGYAHPEEAARRIREIVALGQPVRGEEVALSAGRTCLRDFIPIVLEGKSCGRLWHHIDITRRKQAEKERDRVFEYSLDMLCVAGFDGYFKRVSPSFEKILGWSEAELLSKPFLDFMHPDDREETLQATKAHERGTETIQLENRYRCKDGSCKWIAWNAHAIVEEQLVVAVARDITERKRMEEARHQRAEEALRMSEEEFRSLAEAVPQIVWATRPDGWNIFFNQQWVDYTGMTMEESYGHGWNTPFHPEDKQRAWEAWQRATQHHERYSLECRLRRADGVYRWWLIRGRPMLGANGEILKWFGTCTDIEDIKRAEAALQQAHDTLEQRVRERTEQLQQNEALLRSITDSSPDPIFLKDRGSRLVLANPATLAALQKRAEDVLGKTDEESYDDPALGRLIMANDRHVMESGQTEVIEEVVPSPTGPRTFLSAKTPYRDTGGQIIGIIGIARDITERKRTEEALRFLAQCGTAVSGEGFFQALARYLGQSLDMDYVCIDRLEAGSLSARTVAIYFDGKLEDNVSYTLKDTPCGDVVGKTICCFPRDVRHLFPKDAVLQEMLAESYVGVTLWGSQGQPIGLIALLARKPLADPRLATSILQVVAVRAAAELERQQAEAEVRRHAEELRAANEDLTRFNDAMVGRELRMIELKQEINALCAQFGQAPRYATEPGEAARPLQ